MEKTKEKLIEAATNLGEGIGLNRAVCQIYALLYLSDHPLSPTEIGKILGMSKGNVSINLRTLEQWDAVKKIWRKGYSRALYTANENIEEIVLNKLKTGIEKRLKYIKPIISLAKENPSHSDENFSEKINQIEKLLSKIEFFLSNFETIKSFTIR